LSRAQPSINLLLSQDRISEAISELADCLNEEYAENSLFLIAVLKGSICFVTDLMRKLNMDVEIGFIQASSYGQSGTERKELTVSFLEPLDIEGKEVLLLDDIFDSGTTLATLMRQLQEKRPRTLKTAVLLSKKVKRAVPFEPNYTLFDIEDRFVVGYGLDYKEKYRHLPAIYTLEERT